MTALPYYMARRRSLASAGEGEPGGEPLSAFVEFGSPYPLASHATSPGAFYVSSTDKTIILWEGVLQNPGAVVRRVYCTPYDHAAEDFEQNAFVTFGSTLSNNNHGVLAGCRDFEGYLHAFGQAHNSNMQHSSTTAADGYLNWTARTAISGSYAYPKPISTATGIYLFMRKAGDGSNPYPLVLRKTTALASGVPTWGSEVVIATPGSNQRFYAGDVIDDGTDIHIIGTFSPNTDTERRHVYYLKMAKADDSVRNHAGTTTVAAGSLPLTSSNLDDFRIVDHGSNYGGIPGFALDSTGKPHVVYRDGAVTTGPFDLKHIMDDGAGGWTSATAIGTMHDRISAIGVVPLASGAIDVYFAEDSAAAFTFGGNMVRKSRSSGGSWSSQVTIATAGAKPYEPIAVVRDGHAGLRVVLADTLTDWETNPASITEANLTSLYVYGDGGGLARAAHDPYFWFNAFLCSFDGANAATSATDDSNTGHTLTFGGSAQLSTAQAKFGASSLRLTGGDSVSLGNHAKFALGTSSFVIEGFVRFNALPTSGQACLLLSKWGASGNRSFLFQVNGDGNIYFTASTNVTGASAAEVLLSAAWSGLLTTDTWYHLAVERASNSYRLYVDGVVVATADPGARTFTTSTAALTFGATAGGVAGNQDVWLDEWRLTNGWWRYNGAFTPTAVPFLRY